MDRLFVDTGAWAALYNVADPAHTAVSATLQKWQDRLVTSEYVFDELVTLLRCRVGHHAATMAGRALRSHDVAMLAMVEPEDLETAWSQFEAETDKSYSFTDCTSFALMRRLHLKAAAAVDEHFRQAGFRVLPDS